MSDPAWKEVGIIRENEGGPFKYSLELPEPLASWDVWDYWEKERLASMAKELKKTDILIDIGAEQGWMSALFSKYITPNLILVEPTPEFWPNIRQTFERNKLSTPIMCYDGFFSDDDRLIHPGVTRHSWPSSSQGELIDKLPYRNLHQLKDVETVPQVTLDTFIKRWTTLAPDAITIDVEGAELKVLHGAREFLDEHHPKVWVSIHPDLAERDYGIKDGQVQAFMKHHRYRAEHLATDHEEHWYFYV